MTDSVRRLCGDKDSIFLSDTDLAFFLIENNDNVYLAAASACEAMAAQLFLKGSRKVEDISISYTPESLLAWAKQLRARVAVDNIVPYAGGLSQSDKWSRETDTDRTQPAFLRDLQQADAVDNRS